jgi:hypothetical protein
MPAPDEPRDAGSRVRAEAAPAYLLAYEEARRALDGQERALAAFRSRAGVVLSAAAIITSFLGGQALDEHGFTAFSWAATGAFVILGIAALCVLWPDDQWEFETMPKRLLATYAEPLDGIEVPIHVIHRELALHMEDSYLHNEKRRLTPIRWFFRVAVVALVAEVALWLADLAVGA